MPEKRTGKKITFRGKTKVCEFYKGKPWNKPLTANMKKFEKETGKKAIYRGVVTGTYEYWKHWKNEFTVRKRKTKNEVKKTEKRISYDETYVKYSIPQLTEIAIKHKSKLPRMARRQIIKHIDSYNKTTSLKRAEWYKLKILQIFDRYNVPYDKKMVATRKVLIDA